MDEHILAAIEDLMCEVRILKQLVQSLVQTEQCDLPEGVELPLQNMQEVDKMEQLLDSDNILKQMVCHWLYIYNLFPTAKYIQIMKQNMIIYNVFNNNSTRAQVKQQQQKKKSMYTNICY